MFGLQDQSGRQALTASGWSWVLAIAVIVALAAIAPGPAQTVVLDQIAGPYEITVGASPVPLKVGQGHLSVLVQRRSNARIITDAHVTVTAVSVEGGAPPIIRPATHEGAADERQYGTRLTFDRVGRWEITVEIEGPDGPATVQFLVTVQRDFPAQPVMYLGLVGIPLAGVLLIVRWLRSGGERA